jgi:hypothetical protein
VIQGPRRENLDGSGQLLSAFHPNEYANDFKTLTITRREPIRLSRLTGARRASAALSHHPEVPFPRMSGRIAPLAAAKSISYNGRAGAPLLLTRRLATIAGRKRFFLPGDQGTA